MNPITQTKNQNAMNERELRLGYTGTESSWHRQYKDSAWIFVGGLDYELTEGDIICVFSQYGEIANINLVRDKDTGRSKGFAFVCYENQKSTVLATDNLNGIKIAGRIIRVDHVEKYKVPTVGLKRVGRQDDNQMPARIGDGEFTSVRDYVREYGCGPEAMKKIAALQKDSKTSNQHESGRPKGPLLIKRSPKDSFRSRARSPSERSRSPPRRRSPGSPTTSGGHSSAKRFRSPSVSPPRNARGSRSPGNSRRQQGISPPRNSRRDYRDEISPPRHNKSRFSRDRHSNGHSYRSRDYRR